MRRTSHLSLIVIVSLLGSACTHWRPADGPLETRWTDQVSPTNPHPEYPRPHMRRDVWTNLNGLWDYAIRPRTESRPDRYDGKILVPFPVESALSGVMKSVGAGNAVWYRRRVDASSVPGQRLLLHFGAVDWETTVWLNDKVLGEHRGGYDPFTFDLTDHLDDTGDQELVVKVHDPADEGWQPRGKQVSEPRGIWYTSVTGIWQTVWLEPVPESRVERVLARPQLDRNFVEIRVEIKQPPTGGTLIVEVLEGDRSVARRSTPITPPQGKRRLMGLAITVPEAKAWSPDTPFLYDLRVSLERDGKTIDRVESYFGMRKVELARDSQGRNRIFLNGKPTFLIGPLDQGWWPDGLYTAPTDDALRYDVETTRRLGFNMARKHVKIEPARWYYHCDRAGLLVWQDMPSGDRYIGGSDPDLKRTRESGENYYDELAAMIRLLEVHPSVIVWVPFNEGWGQFRTDQIIRWIKHRDPFRLVDGPSGWTDRGTGDLHDIHSYPGPAMPPLEEKRAAVLGEFGGLGLPLEGHLWGSKKNWGYRTFKTTGELREAYDRLMERLLPLYARGLAAAVYTQTTDVEGEVNGLMTYDRKVLKFDPEHMARLHAQFAGPPPTYREESILPTSELEPASWRYTLKAPPRGWEQPGFEDHDWQAGAAGFGRKGTPGAVIRTEWVTPDIWIRRSFVLDAPTSRNLHLRIHHDEDAEVYLNGKRVADLSGYTTSYVDVRLPEHTGILKRGSNVIAIHCHQTGGGQFIDAGLVSIEVAR